METILKIEGNVKFPIYLDPGVWIFDDRKIDMDQWLPHASQTHESEQDQSIKKMAARWQHDLLEGSAPPKNDQKPTKKAALLNGTFGIAFKPFLMNCQPREDATQVVIQTKDGAHPFSLEQAQQFIICFSHRGKRIEQDGPIHIYFGNGSNRDKPLANIQSFTVI